MMNHVAALHVGGSAETFYDVRVKDGRYVAIVTNIEDTGIRQGGAECASLNEAKGLVMDWAREDYRHVLGHHHPRIHGDAYPVLRLA